jgi:HAD superfamily hydrolase (TIGR01509 family)
MKAPLPSSAITFDLWHTLIYLGPRAEERYVQRQISLAVETLEVARPLPGAPRRSREDLAAIFQQERVRAVAEADKGHVVSLTEQLTRVARAAGRQPRPAAYLTALGKEIARTPFRMAPGAIATLRRLRSEGYRIAVVSNTVGEPGAFLRPILHRMGLDRGYEFALFSDEERWTKPAPAIFRKALRALGSRPSQALHVGDGWGDLEGARRAGYRAGIYFTGLQEYGPSYRALHAASNTKDLGADFRIQRLAELPALARKLLPVP